MSHEPTRLSEQADDLGELLTSAKAVPPMTAEDKAAILHGVLKAMPADPPGGEGVPAAAKASAPWLVGVGAVLLATGIYVLSRGHGPPPPLGVVPSVSAQAPPPPAEPNGEPPEALAPNPRPPEPKPSVAPSFKAAVTVAATATATAAPADPLARESALVGSARSALEGDPGRALALLEEHARQFPRGSMSLERDYLRVKALRRLGRPDEAKQAAHVHLAGYPHSPYTSNLRAMLKELGEP